MITTIDQKIAEIFNNNFGKGGDWPWGNFILCLIAIFLCVILCGAVGLEREKRGRSAGLRTHLLVGVGSCVIMIISIYGFPGSASFADGQATRDVARLAAGVITGCGFLGAGAIIHNQGGIKGLTTAGTIWLVMAIGLACGSMNFILAIASTLVIMLILIVFRKLERRVTQSRPQIVIVCPNDVPVMSILLNNAKKFECKIMDLASQIISDGKEEKTELICKIIPNDKNKFDLNNFVCIIEKETKALSIEVLNHH